MIRLFGGASFNAKQAARDANALIARYGAYLAYEEARRRCRNSKSRTQDQADHWERVSDILGQRTGRSSRSVTFNLEVPQDHARYITLGQPVEVTFNSQPGSVYTGRVEDMQPGSKARQVQPGVLMPPPLQVRISLDDHQMAEQLPAGSTGLAAVFGDDAKASTVTRRVVLRQTAVLNYVN